ncbi:hypothetical protein ES288_A11G224200v1 [Gossypium darwinii]|uniref:Uncharacterized protein n=1 Tax=Gossypium darwinii TaxID=34276 RepID=A0A5D2EMJ4_GOSDA|nr:hypothetical protein ES288_A11G224200v1 [Gossypium darwinii]
MNREIYLHTGKTNYTRLQSKNNLQKAHNGWLLPLQMLMGGIAVANKNDIDQHAVDTVCALNLNSAVHQL